MSPSRDEASALIEATLTAHREWGPDGMPVTPPSWWDLSAADREQSFLLQLEARELERLHNQRGWSSTVGAVMSRISR